MTEHQLRQSQRHVETVLQYLYIAYWNKYFSGTLQLHCTASFAIVIRCRLSVYPFVCDASVLRQNG